jgi:hypothetical protein
MSYTKSLLMSTLYVQKLLSISDMEDSGAEYNNEHNTIISIFDTILVIYNKIFNRICVIKYLYKYTTYSCYFEPASNIVCNVLITTYEELFAYLNEHTRFQYITGYYFDNYMYLSHYYNNKVRIGSYPNKYNVSEYKCHLCLPKDIVEIVISYIGNNSFYKLSGPAKVIVSSKFDRLISAYETHDTLYVLCMNLRPECDLSIEEYHKCINDFLLIYSRNFKLSDLNALGVRYYDEPKYILPLLMKSQC